MSSVGAFKDTLRTDGAVLTVKTEVNSCLPMQGASRLPLDLPWPRNDHLDWPRGNSLPGMDGHAVEAFDGIVVKRGVG